MQQPNPQAQIPVLESRSLARMHLVVMAAVAGFALCLIILIVIMQRSAWWEAFTYSTIVAVAASIASVFAARMAVGKTLDSAITVFMALSAVRLVVSLAGCILAVKLARSPEEATALMVCGYYVATLAVETMLMARAVRALDRKQS